MKITKTELREIIQEVADELGLFEGLTKAQEKLPEPLKKAILKKQGNSDDSSDEEKDVEEGLTKAQEKLPEPLKKAILKKQGNSDDSSDEEETEDVEESIEEGNALGAAVKAARDNGDSEFEVGGKKYKLKEKKEITEQEDTEEFVGATDEDEDVEEGNAFGAAVKQAREDGETEFEVDGKKYKVRENWTKITLAEKLDRILGNRQVL